MVVIVLLLRGSNCPIYTAGQTDRAICTAAFAEAGETKCFCGHLCVGEALH